MDRAAKLAEHRGTIEEIISRGEAIIARDVDADVAALTRTRWELVRALTAYQLFKHREVFDPAIRLGTPFQQATAERLKGQCIAVSDEFRAYVGRWAGAGLAAQWTTYQPAARRMVVRLRQHLAREESAVLDLITSGARRR